MAQVNLRSLVARLNDPCRRTLEAAAGLCLSRSHYNVEIEHWLLKLLEAPDTDLLAILRRFEVDPSRLQRDLVKVGRDRARPRPESRSEPRRNNTSS